MENRDPYESENTKDLHIDLCLMQSEYPDIGGNRENPHFKSNYADFYAIVKAIRPLMKKYGFSITFREYMCTTFGLHLRTKLTHKSGQWIENRSPLKEAKPGEQEYGKALTYRMRYSIKAILGIPISKDPDDDDGEYERKRVEKKDNPNRLINVLEIARLKEFIDSDDQIEKGILSMFKKNELKQLTRSEYQKIVEE